MRRVLLLSLALVFVAGSVMAAPKKESKKPGNHREAKWTLEKEKDPVKELSAKAATLVVDLPMVILPVSDRGYLTNYAFVAIRINLQEGEDAWSIRSKSHFLKDAIIRKSHKRKTEILDKETNGVDQEKLTAMINAAIEPWVAKQRIDSIEFLKIDLQR
ncbi:MAG: hypothetical protein COA60_005750 [Robiginitomaculum sp.]|nr:hypothetical protein [Robiginitomaculum sp.]